MAGPPTPAGTGCEAVSGATGGFSAGGDSGSVIWRSRDRAPLCLLFAGGVYRRYWAYANVNDLTAVYGAVAMATLLLEVLTLYTAGWLAV